MLEREKKRELVGRKEGALGYGMVGDRGKGGVGGGGLCGEGDRRKWVQTGKG